MANNKPPPRCKAILLCDQTIRADNGKISLIGIFNRFRLPRFPAETKPATVYLQLVDGIGRYDIVLEIRDLRENEVIERTPSRQIEFRDRLHKVHLMLPLHPLTLPHPGAYDVVALANDEEVERQQFIATTPEQPG